MEKAEILSAISEIIEKIIGVNCEKITEQSDFRDDLGADSLDIMELILELEFRFKVSVSENEVENVQTVNDAVELIYKLIPKENGKTV